MQRKKKAILALGLSVAVAAPVCGSLLAHQTKPSVSYETMPPDGPFDQLGMAGEAAMKSGNYSAAESDFNQDLTQNPGRADLVVGLAETYQDEGKLSQAIQLESSLLTDTTDPRNMYYTYAWDKGLLELSLLQCQAGDWPDAVTAFHEATSVYITQPLYSRWGKLPTLYSQFDTEVIDFNDLEMVDNIEIGLHENDYHYRPDLHQDALAHFQAAAAADPNSDVAKFFCAYGEAVTGDAIDATAGMTALLGSSNPNVRADAAHHLQQWATGNPITPDTGTSTEGI